MLTRAARLVYDARNGRSVRLSADMVACRLAAGMDCDAPLEPTSKRL